MLTYNQLNQEQKEKAFSYALGLMLQDISCGAIRFNDELNGNNLQERIDSALEKAEKMKTPWFSGEFIYESCKEEIDSMVIVQVEESLYAEEHENVIYLADM